MIGTSFGEWLAIRASILLFQYLPAIYVAILVGSLVIKHDPVWAVAVSIAMVVLLAAEALYFIFIYTPHKRRLQRVADHPIPLSHTERRQLFNKCMANTSHLEEYLRGWFLGADLKDIRRGNLQEFFLWAFFDTQVQNGDPQTVDQGTWDEVNEYVRLTEDRLGHSLGHGWGSAKSLRLTLEGISTSYRCLLWYVIVFFIDQATHFVLTWHGFRYYARPAHVARNTFPPRPQELFAKHRSPVPELSYWFRPHTSESKRPIVFWHGIGIGLWTYVWFIVQLPGSHGSGVIVPEMLPISFRLTDPPPRKDELLSRILGVLDHHQGWEKFELVSHSYGSIPTTHMLRSTAFEKRIQSIILIDPVTIMLHLPNVAYNFTRRVPKRANEWQLWYFASTDLGVAHCLGRHFFWRENILWKEDLLLKGGRQAIQDDGSRTRRVAVFLSGRDLIVDTAAVTAYLTTRPQTIGASDSIYNAETGSGSDLEDEDIQVVVFPHLDHAQVFDSKRECDRVVEVIQTCSRIGLVDR